jgi:hypothetical protein
MLNIAGCVNVPVLLMSAAWRWTTKNPIRKCEVLVFDPAQTAGFRGREKRIDGNDQTAKALGLALQSLGDGTKRGIG